MDDVDIALPFRTRASHQKEAHIGRGSEWSKHRISPSVCASVLVGLDFLLIVGIEILTGSQPINALSGHVVTGDNLIFVFAPLVMLLALWRHGTYVMIGAAPHLSAVSMGWLQGSGLIVLTMYALDALGIAALRYGEGVLNSVSLIAFVAIGGAAVLGRNALWLALRPRLASHLVSHSVVVAGAGEALFAFVDILQRRSETTKVVAVVSGLDRGADEVIALARTGTVRTVFIVLSTAAGDAAGPLLRKLAALPVAVRIVPEFASIAVAAHRISLEAGLPVLHISDPPLSTAGIFLKRMEDIILSSVLIIVALPVILLASIAIKLETPGPVLFRQPRHGLNGLEIEVYKFRTMYAHLEDRLASCQTSRDDPRVTRVGAVLRRHSLDELPQLFNVLAGPMSLVGPRPHAPATTVAGQSLELVVANYTARHRVKPGITGWAQVSGCRGNLDSVEKAVRRVKHDLYYIDNWSLCFDLRVIVRTIGVILHDDQAF